MSAEPVVLRFDVTSDLPQEVTLGRTVEIAARVFAPARPRPGRASLLTCLHGGSYDWRYYHAQIPGHPGYSMAEHMAGLGHVVLVLDQLGVGESTRPAVPHKAGRRIVAAANHAVVRQACARLAEGTLHPQVPPAADPLKVGIGHSMGGMTLVTQQAGFATYDLAAVLGHSNMGAHLVIDGKLVKNVVPPFDPAAPAYKRLGRDKVLRSFHWDTTPSEVLAVDEAVAVEYPGLLGWEANEGTTGEDAGHIRTPVFLAMGERDVSPDPYGEVGFYKGSADVTFYRLDEAAHCHNFAPTRARLWDRLDQWITSLTEPLD
jgi:hypothetical protein